MATLIRVAHVPRSEREAFSFDRIETVQFFPRLDYLQKCVEPELVRRYLDKARYRKPIYIITGLKIVSGARASSTKSKMVGGQLGAEVDATGWSGGSVPVGGGATIEGESAKKTGVSWEGSSDFVFAFRVRKVLVEKTGVVKNDQDYRTGAMLGRQREGIEAPRLSIVNDRDTDAEEEGYHVEELMEGDVMVNCAIPNVEEDDD